MERLDDLPMWRPVTPLESLDRKRREAYLKVTPEEKDAALDGVIAELERLSDQPVLR